MPCLHLGGSRPSRTRAYAGVQGGHARSPGKPAPSRRRANRVVGAPTRADALARLRAEGYAYDHDEEGGVAGQSYFPEGVERARLYEPTGRGAERELRHRAQWLEERRRARAAREGG